MNLSIIPGAYSVCRLSPAAPVPDRIQASVFYSVTKTAGELSIVCESKYLPDVEPREDGWVLIKVEGPLDFSLTGILASLAVPLAAAGVSIFAISTFDTDYLLVTAQSLDPAKKALEAVGFAFV